MGVPPAKLLEIEKLGTARAGRFFVGQVVNLRPIGNRPARSARTPDLKEFAVPPTDRPA
jgi:hypothetical protein